MQLATKNIKISIPKTKKGGSEVEEYPGSTDENEYIKCMDAVECYEKMVQTSRLIYNDSVTKLNRELHIFPTSVLAHMLGFEKRDYLVEN